MRAPVVAGLCYLLVGVAFVADMLTPQLLVVALAMNGPIALSSIALRPRLTNQLIVFAEIANVLAGYLNGVAAHHRWDAVAIGDRALLAASFLLVGYMTILTQRYAAQAGREGLRSAQIRDEQALRRAVARVRASLSPDLVRNAIVREARELFGAGRVLLSSRGSLLSEPRLFAFCAGDTEVSVNSAALPAEAASVIQRLGQSEGTLLVRPGDVSGRYLLERFETSAAMCARLNVQMETFLLLAAPKEIEYSGEQFRLFGAFVAQAATALQQSALFETLARQNDEIAQQRNLLAERNEIIRDIVYAIAHDLRTPLVAANTTMRQALRGAYGPLPAQYAAILESTIASNEQLRHLAESLLLVARYELGEASTFEERIDVADLCESVVRELLSLASEKKIQLVLSDFTASAPSILADVSEIRRAVTNLIANALWATPEYGYVRVEIRKGGSTCSVTIRDDGYGVAVERQATLFERFAGTEAGRGTGLGLYIVRRIAERYGGSVRFTPGTDRGSAFGLELPLATA